MFYWRRLTRGDIKPENLPWGSFGPAIITYFAKKHGAAALAQSQPVFYPVSYDDSDALFSARERVEEMIKPETRVVHMWHSKLKGHVGRIPRGSYLDVICRKHGIEA
jgi:hypothetical protein